MPLFRGATSRIILAHLGDETIRQLVENEAAMLRRAGLPTRVEALRVQLAAWRESRVVHSRGEVDPEALGWAVPIHHGRQLLGSLSVVLSGRAPEIVPQRIASQLERAALRVQGRLEA
jgi:DNA-binding IclR family transcriptional regulator